MLKGKPLSEVKDKWDEVEMRIYLKENYVTIQDYPRYENVNTVADNNTEIKTYRPLRIGSEIGDKTHLNSMITITQFDIVQEFE